MEASDNSSRYVFKERIANYLFWTTVVSTLLSAITAVNRAYGKSMKRLVIIICMNKEKLKSQYRVLRYLFFYKTHKTQHNTRILGTGCK